MTGVQTCALPILAMPIDDYRKFLTLTSELPENFIIQSQATDSMYPYFFCKLCNTQIDFETKHKTKPKGIYIDIFPLVGAREPCGVIYLLFNLQLIMSYVIQVKLGWQEKKAYKKLYARCAYNILDLFSVKLLFYCQKKILNFISAESSNYFFSPGGPYKADKEFYPKAWFISDIKMIFEKEIFSVPLGWKLYLSRNYGDYMKLPSEKEQYSRHK